MLLESSLQELGMMKRERDERLIFTDTDIYAFLCQLGPLPG